MKCHQRIYKIASAAFREALLTCLNLSGIGLNNGVKFSPLLLGSFLTMTSILTLARFTGRASILLTLLAISCGLGAEQRIEHLYEARIPIAARDTATQQEAMQRGLASVLNKISGYSATAEFPELANSLANAPNLVSEFGLQSIELPSEDQLTTRISDALYMRFVSSQVDQIIRQFEIPVWPASRSEVVVLILAELGGAPHFLTEENHPAIFAYLRRAAFDRGFAIQLFSQNQPDSSLISAEHAWALDDIALRASLATYSADQIAVLRLTPDSADEDEEETSMTLLGHVTDKYFGDLSVVSQELEFRSDIEGENLIQALNRGLNSYLDELSLKTAFVASTVADTRVMMEIRDIPDFESFRRVRSYLQELEQIESFRILRLSMERVVVQLEFQSGLELLHSSLVNSGILVSMDSGEISGLSEVEQLSYRYRSLPISR